MCPRDHRVVFAQGPSDGKLVDVYEIKGFRV